MTPKILLTLAATAVIASGCDSGGDSAQPATGPLTVRVTDMPINTDEINGVCIDFDSITVHYAGQDDLTLDYNPSPTQVSSETHCIVEPPEWDGTTPTPPVRLDALTGLLSVTLAENQEIPVGRVTWIRLHFTGDAYVNENDNPALQVPLRCPSCDITDNNTGRGFKLNRPFEVTSDGVVLTIDIDLAKSLHRDANGYVLRPTARMEIDGTFGVIAGEVDPTVIEAQGGTPYTGTDVDTGCAVYVYDGNGAMPAELSAESTEVSTASVRYILSTGLYRYAAGVLPGGTEAAPMPYTVALTCDLDTPENLVAEPEVVGFTGEQDVPVIAGQIATADFPPPPVP